MVDAKPTRRFKKGVMASLVGLGAGLITMFMIESWDVYADTLATLSGLGIGLLCGILSFFVNGTQKLLGGAVLAGIMAVVSGMFIVFLMMGESVALAWMQFCIPIWIFFGLIAGVLVANVRKI